MSLRQPKRHFRDSNDGSREILNPPPVITEQDKGKC